MEQCPCCSDKDFESCCAPFLNGEQQAPTAEVLMRSRYTAYAKGNIDYVRNTTHKSSLGEFDEEAARQWSKDSTWHGLEIVNVRGGTGTDKDGEVEFIARYTQKDSEKEEHHERAIFKKEGDKWYFVDGRIVGAGTYIRPDPKVGRNDPCPCGSGRKFKKCCANK